MSGVQRGGLGSSIPDMTGAWLKSEQDLAAQTPRMPLRMQEGTQRRRARGATHTAFWRTWAQIQMENEMYFEHL